jgi:hypothetical protein
LGVQDQPPAPVPAPAEKTDVHITTTEQHSWYVNPVWVSIGVLGALVVVILIVMAARGGESRGGTTVVHE